MVTMDFYHRLVGILMAGAKLFEQEQLHGGGHASRGKSAVGDIRSLCTSL